MELDLFKTLVTLIEAKAPAKEPVKIAKAEIEPEPVADEKPADTSFAPDKTAFFFKPKFDIYGMLEQTDDMDLRREAKRVYAIFGREHERSAVYGISSSAEREFMRVSRMLGISTDGVVTLERVKRAGFTVAGRIGVKRLMKHGDFLVSLAGPNDDETTITFYTAKPVEKA